VVLLRAIHLKRTPRFELCVVRCGVKNTNQEGIMWSKENWTTCLKFVNYSNYSTLNNLYDLYDQLMRIFTLILNKMFLRALKLMK
jgi:hypothetical protein